MDESARLMASAARVRRAANVAAMLGVVVSLVGAIASIATLPAQAPLHFGASGQATGTSSKYLLLFFPAMAAFIGAFLTIFEYLPIRYYNFPWRITEENAERQLALGRALMAALKAETVWMMTGLLWSAVLSARRGQAVGIVVFFSALAGVIAATIIVWLVVAWRAR